MPAESLVMIVVSIVKGHITLKDDDGKALYPDWKSRVPAAMKAAR
ncbi:hypothetical protein LCGC14_1853840, partial [marine sediment metagenome]